MDKERKIKEVMELVDEYASEYVDYTNDLPSDSVAVWMKIESKLRTLLKRKPLSDKEIEEIASDVDRSDDHENHIDEIGLAKAIERAHGIGI